MLSSISRVEEKVCPIDFKKISNADKTKDKNDDKIGPLF